jgi:predicted ATPase/DNA-binding XRE family transcriptional regulator
MPASMSFGTWLRQKRRSLDLTQKVFADQIGCAEITVRRMEADEYKPSKELAFTLFEKLGIPESERSQWILFARGVSSLPIQSIPHGNKPKTNLPASLTSFIGREKEQSDVIQFITKFRLVTLRGAGGVGKTRLALKVGEQVLGNYADGVWLVELAPILDPLLVPRTTAIAVGLRDEPQRPVIDMLSDYLREKQMLIILDNCEHLLDDCAQLADMLLKHCPSLRILATSREALGILGEAGYPVPSLELPDIEQLVENFRGYESVRLFEERAQLARMDFSLDLENVPSVAKICSRLDGIPLAIELAAARVSTFSTEQIVRQLNESFNILTGGSRTALPRHQTLRASMNWSWGLLTEAEQILMRQLSVFAGGWTLESATAACDGDILNLTSALVKKSLIVVNQQPGREPRYRFHEVVRQYAHEKLVEAGEDTIMWNKHRNVFLAFVERAEPEILLAEQKKWIDALEDESDNIRTALSWSIENQNAEQALRFCSALTIFWERHKHYHEAVLACKDALNCVLQDGSLKTTALYASVLASSAFYIAVTELIPLSDSSIRASFEQAQKSYDAIGDYSSTGPVLTSQMLTYIYMSLNDLSSAERCISQWYKKVKASGHQWGIALAKRSMAEFSMAKGNLTSALVFWQESYELFMKIGDMWAAMEVSQSLIRQRVIRGEFEDGIRLSKQNLLFYEQYGDPGGLASSFINLGTIAREQGEYKSARHYFTDAIAVITEIGNSGWSIEAAEHVAYLDYLEGNIRAARAKYETLFTRIKNIPVDSTYGFFTPALHK